MSDELRKAAQEILDDVMFVRNDKGGERVKVPEAWKKLAEAWETEHPCDDAIEAEETWLAAVGGKRGYGASYSFWLDRGRKSLVVEVSALSLVFAIVRDESQASFYLMDKPTRGDVRRLCKAFGIPLKEAR